MVNGQTMVFNLCRDKISSENLARVQDYCKNADNSSFAYHIQGSTCTAFNSKEIVAEEIPAKTDGTKQASSNGGLSLTYAVAGSKCIPNDNKEKKLKISLFCDEKQTSMRYLGMEQFHEQCMVEL